MNLSEIKNAIEQAEENVDQFKLIMDALMTLEADFRFGKTAHDRFLPAARDYRHYLQGPNSNDRLSSEFKILRGRLGASSRILYKSQRETFIRLFGLVNATLALGLMPEWFIEALWQKFKRAERKWLASGRVL